MLRALPLCTCCRQYPGAATGVRYRSLHRVVSAFPDRLVGSACASSFSRLARCSLALRPAHSRCHRMSWHASPEASTVSLPPQLLRLLPAGAGCRVGLSPTEKAPPYHGAQPERTTRNQAVRSPPGRVSSPGEFHPEALAEPDVNVSVHPAPIIQPGRVHQDSSEQRAEADSELPAQANVWPVRVNDFETSVSGSLVSNLRAPRGRDWTCLAG